MSLHRYNINIENLDNFMIEGIKIADYLERKKNYEKHMNRLQLITQRKHTQPK